MDLAGLLFQSWPSISGLWSYPFNYCGCYISEAYVPNEDQKHMHGLQIAAQHWPAFKQIWQQSADIGLLLFDSPNSVILRQSRCRESENEQ